MKNITTRIDISFRSYQTPELKIKINHMHFNCFLCRFNTGPHKVTYLTVTFLHVQNCCSSLKVMNGCMIYGIGLDMANYYYYYYLVLTVASTWLSIKHYCYYYYFFWGFSRTIVSCHAICLYCIITLDGNISYWICLVFH